jgi:hypothetical protein
MKIDKIFLQTHTKFAKALADWAQDMNVEIVDFHERNIEEVDQMDGLLIFNENQTIEREAAELRDVFDLKQRPIQKIDINGTLVVGISNFTFWLERNNCKKILVVGSDHLLENPNLERFLSNIKLK